MFKNENYEWLLDYEIPSDPMFGGLYWMYMYNKLFSQGTDEDRYNLENYYKEYDPKTPFPFSLLTGIFCYGERYEKTVRSFIYDVKMANYDDDEERDNIIKKDNLEKSIEEARKKTCIQAYGYDRKEAEREAVAVEAELDMNHTPEQNEFEYDKMNSNNVLKYGCGHYLNNNVKVLRKEDIVIENEFTGKTYVIHTLMFDKYKGYYNFAIYCDNEKNIFTGEQIVHQGWSSNYADRHFDRYHHGEKLDARIRGIDSMYREFLDDFKGMVKFNRYNYGHDWGGVDFTVEYQAEVDAYLKQLKVEEKMKKRKAIRGEKANKPKETKVDISKINKALGLENSDDDLNGDIF